MAELFKSQLPPLNLPNVVYIFLRFISLKVFSFSFFFEFENALD